MSQKGHDYNWRTSVKVLEDVFEALVGAIFLDQGLMQAKNFLHRCLHDMTDWNVIWQEDNYKDTLMRQCQKIGVALPAYEVTAVERDVNGKQVFVVRCTALMDGSGIGRGTTKRAAEQAAAYVILKSKHIPIIPSC